LMNHPNNFIFVTIPNVYGNGVKINLLFIHYQMMMYYDYYWVINYQFDLIFELID
jgi:hypothetical protein